MSSSGVDELVKESSVSQTSKQKRRECICQICEDLILDAKGRRKVQDAIFCDGMCQTWLHRVRKRSKESSGCHFLWSHVSDLIAQGIGPFRAAFEAHGATSKDFYCSHCRLKYQARVSSNIVWRCRCFVTFKKLIAFLLSRTNFATSASPSILTRASSLNDGCGWCIIVNPPNLNPPICRILRFRQLFHPKIFPAIQYNIDLRNHGQNRNYIWPSKYFLLFVRDFVCWCKCSNGNINICVYCQRVRMQLVRITVIFVRLSRLWPRLLYMYTFSYGNAIFL